MHHIHEDYLRSGLFGIQDGLVSTTGVVIGISAGVEHKAIIILAAFVAVTVEASSMAAGQYSSEKAVHQMDRTGKHTDSLILGALIMFFGYLLGGMVPIIPTVLFNQPQARIFAILAAFIGLFILGYTKGHLVKVKPLRSALELFIIGAIATTIGLIVGYLFRV
ncbi:VIT1/CCC1 transporter family protein [Candidatus Daviesbacteria bacterium]|nr:VIT1/CCC1 transporter family protein [Candidatus Daviesbacteria bacterium]MBI4035423.1 VIT1/CCC1 transporter family protein [Candidatus Daviesbacteria bacterium]